MYDFQIDSDVTGGPAVTLNNDTFVPPGPPLGWTPLTSHTARPVPWDTTIDDYRDQPRRYETADLIAIVDEIPVPNDYGWNLTCVMLTSFAYGTTRDNIFENHWENISVIEVFLQKKNLSDDGNSKGVELREVQPIKEQWTLEWWRIVPVGVMHSGECLHDNYTAFILPDGLRDKLLRNGTAGMIATPNTHIETEHSSTITIGPYNPFQIWILMIIVTAAIVMLAYCLAVVGTALLGSTSRGYLDRWLDGRRTEPELGEKVQDEGLLVDEETRCYYSPEEASLR